MRLIRLKKLIVFLIIWINRKLLFKKPTKLIILLKLFFEWIWFILAHFNYIFWYFVCYFWLYLIIFLSFCKNRCLLWIKDVQSLFLWIIIWWIYRIRLLSTCNKFLIHHFQNQNPKPDFPTGLKSGSSTKKRSLWPMMST